jgi:sugar phosphate permease
VWCFLFSVSSSAIVVIPFTSSKELFPVEMAGTAVGLVNLFPFLGGAVYQPLLGWMLEVQGRGPGGEFPAEAYQSAFLLYFVSACVALGAALLAKETFPRRAA